MSRVGRALLWMMIPIVVACGGNRDRKVPVVLISIDTLRALDVSGYGYERTTTPNLDRFAEEAVLFRDAICNSNNTLTSHASILTSLYPSVHGATPGTPISAESETIAEILSGHGYETAFFAAHGDWLSSKYGFDRGVESFRSEYVKAPSINEWTLDWLGDGRDAPFFLFLHYYDAHSDFAGDGDLPYAAPDGFRGKFSAEYAGAFTGCDPEGDVCASAFLKRLSDDGIRLSEEDRSYVQALYDEEILYTDAMVGKVLDRLRELDLFDRSIIVITADHGEEFQEHGRFLHGAVREPVVRVPLWIRFPGGKRKGEVSAMAEGIDIVPTILDAIGVEIPERLQGESLLPVIDGEQPKTEFAIIHSVAMRSSRWKAMVDDSGKRALYDLSADPGESTDVSDRHPEVMEQMTDVLADWMDRYEEMADRFGGRVGDPRRATVEMDEAERRRLEDLGYKLPERPKAESDDSSDDSVPERKQDETTRTRR